MTLSIDVAYQQAVSGFAWPQLNEAAPMVDEKEVQVLAELVNNGLFAAKKVSFGNLASSKETIVVA